ncbi:hypothetical protein M1146_07590, partial [Patescibacteria group bacterium]|nr:hypothetical protein [Patescibacteria group bacterium]
GDSLSASMFGVGYSITNDIFQKDLEDSSGLLVNETRDTLHTTTTSETANSGFCDALNVVAKNLSVALGTSMDVVYALKRQGRTLYGFGG